MALLGGVPVDEDAGHRGRNGELGMAGELPVGHLTGPAQERAAGPALEEQQMVLGEHAGEGLVVAGSRGMGGRLKR